MSSKKLFFFIFLFALSFFYLETFGRRGSSSWEPLNWQDPDGRGDDSKYGKLYDTEAMESLKGEIVAIEEMNPYSGMRTGIHLILKTKDGQVSVQLGPSWYILNQGLKFEVGEVVEVTGSRIPLVDKHVVVAKEVRKSNGYLQLRDEFGIPYWCSKCAPNRDNIQK
jgi:hypothetical protein